MPEVLDIVHRLTYEANTAGLDKAFSSIEKEINGINALSSKITELQQKRAAADRTNIDLIGKLDAQILRHSRSLEKEIALLDKRIRSDDNLRRSLAATGLEYARMSDRISKGSSTATNSLIDLGRIIQDAPYGLRGYANNLVPAIENLQRLTIETGSVGNALKALAGSLIGGAGIGFAISIVTSLLISFGSELKSSGESAEDASEKQKRYRKEIEELNKQLVDSIKLQSDLGKARDAAANAGSNAAQRELEASKARGATEEEIFVKEQEVRQKRFIELEKQLGLFQQVRNQIQELADTRLSASDINKGITLESIVRNGAYNLLVNTLGLSDAEAEEQSKNIASSFRNRSNIVKLFKKEEDQLQEDIKDILSEIDNAQTQFDRELNVRSIDRQKEFDLLNNQTLQQIDALINTEREVFNLRNQQRADDGIAITKEQYDSEKKERDFNISRLEAIREINVLTIEIVALKKKIAEAERQGRDADRVTLQLRADELDRQRQGIEIPRQQIDPLLGDTRSSRDRLLAAQLDKDAYGKTDQDRLIVPDFLLKEDENQFKKREDLNKKHLKEIISTYKAFEQSISQIINDISERQIKALDQEIQVRQERVRQAEKLAERGNTEILRLESERLEESEKLRREAAQRQIAINAALALSNAIVAVATTAAESGVASIATIPAVLAALVAGYSFVRSLDQSTGFKDGVIDLQGPGTEKSDSIPARLSKGESVMTAAATKKYKPLLEAMNEGRLPYTANRPNEFSDKTTTKKLDAIIAAIEGNTVNVKQSLDQYGFIQSVETMQRREARRWRS